MAILPSGMKRNEVIEFSNILFDPILSHLFFFFFELVKVFILLQR